jgi:hypothetical protein
MSLHAMCVSICPGLQTAYYERQALYRHVRRLLALPFLPAEHIKEAFANLRGRIEDERVRHLEAYIETTWMASPTWSVDEWSVFMLSVRTNNDCEGWHRRLNVQARRGTLPFYTLVALLHEEARLVQLTAILVSEKHLKRYQKKVYASVQATLFGAWNDYVKGSRTTSSLLRACSRFYDPMIKE